LRRIAPISNEPKRKAGVLYSNIKHGDWHIYRFVDIVRVILDVKSMIT
jgi:hypothetical protein